MKVIVCTDLEGVSGITSFEDQAAGDGKYYEAAKKLLTAEINAAVEGMLEESVSDILIVDGHGAGGICFEELHPAAKLFHGRPCPFRLFLDEMARRYDVSMMIGQHAMAGTERGTLNHTQSQLHYDYYKLNGKPIGEIAQWALCAGAYGLPMIFLSGDEAACREAEDLIPGLASAAVKIGMSRTSAISFPPAEAQRRIREGVKRALRQQRENPIPPLVWEGPFVLEKRFFHTIQVDPAEATRIRQIDSQTIQLHADNILDLIYA